MHAAGINQKFGFFGLAHDDPIKLLAILARSRPIAFG
jgi:hypothetical protein